MREGPPLIPDARSFFVAAPEMEQGMNLFAWQAALCRYP